ncbi:hypothetical protein P7C70_g3650, partial [Phenoliferia sp. Uapishka_3]
MDAFRHADTTISSSPTVWGHFQCLACDPLGNDNLSTSQVKRHIQLQSHLHKSTRLRLANLRSPAPPNPRTPAPPSQLESSPERNTWNASEDRSPAPDVPLRGKQPTAFDSGFSSAVEGAQRAAEFMWDPEDAEEDEDSEEEDREMAEFWEGFRAADFTDWAPFKDRGTFLTHILVTIPRASFSRNTIKLILTWAKLMGAREVPAYNALLEARKNLRKATSAPEPTRHVGCNDNIYYTSTIREGIVRDFSSPNIRPHLHLYPRVGEGLSEVVDSRHLSEDLDARVTTPMVSRPSSQSSPALSNTPTFDFDSSIFAFEPARLQDASLVWPNRFFESGSMLFAQAFAVTQEAKKDCDGRTVLHVDRTRSLSFPVSDIAASWPELQREAAFRQVVATDDSSTPLPLPSPQRVLADSLPFFSVPLILFTDDASGNRSRKWNKHWVFYTTNGALARKLQDLEANIRFLAASPSADALEMCEAVVKELNEIFSEPIVVYDCSLQMLVRVRVFLIFVIGDNPMMSDLASCMSHMANFSCRICRYGGKLEERATIEGFESLFRPGEPRTIDFLCTTIHEQLQLAAEDRKEDISKSYTQTGDSIAEELITVLLESCDDYKAEGASRADIRAEVSAELEGYLTQTHMNPFFDLKSGYDVTQGTPPGILHVFLLGPAKYAWSRTLGVGESDDRRKAIRAQVACWLEQASTAGLPAGTTLNAEYFVQHADSLVGKELRLLSQICPIALAPLVESGTVSPEVLKLWRAIGDLGALLYVQTVPEEEIESYIIQLQRAVDFLFAAIATSVPSILLSKIKYHLTAHIPEFVRKFGIPKCFDEERYEAHHKVFRDASDKSNRHRPSFDICRRITDQETTAHILSGGYYKGPNGQMRQASPSLRQLMLSRQASVFRQKFGLEFASRAPHPGKYEKSSEVLSLQSALLHSYSPTFAHPLAPLNPFRINYIVSQDGDICRRGHFIHLTSCTSAVNPVPRDCVARIDEIFLNPSGDSSPFGRVVVLASRLIRSLEPDPGYGAPAYEVDQRMVLAPLKSDRAIHQNAPSPPAHLNVRFLVDFWHQDLGNQRGCNGPTGSGLVSRLFTSRTNLYRRIIVSSILRFQQLHTALSTAHTDFASRVRVLSLDLQPGVNFGTVLQLKQLLTLLVNVTHYAICSPVDSGLVEVILAADFAETALRKLSSLEMYWYNDTRVDPFDFTRLETLQLYPCLWSLRVDTDATDPPNLPINQLRQIPSDPSHEKGSNRSITKLALDGPLSQLAAAGFIRHFPGLRMLQLFDTSPEVDFIPLLEAVCAPESLLSLEMRARDSDDITQPVDHTVSRFTSLEIVALHEGTFSDVIFAALQVLPVCALSFECKDISVERLLDFVVQSRTLRSLRTRLPWLCAKKGDSIGEWKLPSWTRNFNAKGARKLSLMAEELGVEVCDELKDALMIEALFWETLLSTSGSSSAGVITIHNPTTPPTDHLSALPNKLIKSIFALAPDVTQPISQALLAFTQANLYICPEICTPEQLSKFCYALESRSDTGGLVGSLSFNFSGIEDYEVEDSYIGQEGPYYDGTIPVQPTSHPSLERLIQLFTSTTQVKDITTTITPRIVDAILSLTVSTRFLRRLEMLCFRDSSDGSPWELRKYRNLASFPQLYALQVWSKSVEETSGVVKSDDANLPEKNFQLRSLTLRGHLASTGCADFVGHFGGISELLLFDSSQHQDLNQVLERATSDLTSLNMIQSGADVESVIPITSTLQRFHKLEELWVTDDMITDAIFPDFLHDPLPLTSFCIVYGKTAAKTRLKAASIKALIENLPDLEELDVSVFSCDEHSKHQEHGTRYCGGWCWPLDARTRSICPAFNADFTLKDAKTIILAAEQHGVEISGDILMAIELEG